MRAPEAISRPEGLDRALVPLGPLDAATAREASNSASPGPIPNQARPRATSLGVMVVLNGSFGMVAEVPDHRRRHDILRSVDGSVLLLPTFLQAGCPGDGAAPNECKHRACENARVSRTGSNRRDAKATQGSPSADGNGLSCLMLIALKSMRSGRYEGSMLARKERHTLR